MKKIHSNFFHIVIQNKLEELIDNNHQTSTIPNYEPYRLLRDMKEEQDRNEKALIYLRRRLIHPNRYFIRNKFKKNIYLIILKFIINFK